MLSIVSTYQQQYATKKPIIVADSAMFFQENWQQLEKEGYPYIVSARLANAKSCILQTLHDQLIKRDDLRFQRVLYRIFSSVYERGF